MKASLKASVVTVAILAIVVSCKRQSVPAETAGVTIVEKCGYDRDAGDELARSYLDMGITR